MTKQTFPRDTKVLRNAVIKTARALPAMGLTRGTSGNVSARTNTGFLITPSGVPYADLTPDMIVPMDLEAGYFGDKLPSSEWRMHMDFYLARPAAGAVVHCHSPKATALSCLRRGIPAFHYMIGLAGGDRIDCANYATFGTRALSDAMVAALGDRSACLLANHGQITCGKNLVAALKVAEGVEELAEQYMAALSIGEPTILDADEMKEVLRKFSSYGKQTDELAPGEEPAFEMPVKRD